ncbi:hypothetical protein [Cedecea davisae]|uniref:hypothetical protein n=1 Tax=Cedecea davisae TaxID=158484 RepID=UPI00242CCF16|nr:hypothetical protein [Cedecea davisae]
MKHEESSTYSFAGSPGNCIEGLDDFFIFNKSRNIIAIGDEVTAGYKPLENNYALSLERAAYHSLIKNAQELDTVPDLKMGPGLYVDNQKRMVFLAAEKVFSVDKYLNGVIEIKTINYEKKRERLFLFF